ncbi:amidohydrolase family protein [Sphingomonas panacisoli]|uniref:Amidohydrolase family protein n=1 Tax=Sphingomonas panacisoli TaxID=1813879 RepID=A0A5B8LIC4_9SPHN|nr:amidohydrolase family protein [Sphingomonas panacisoli]QDZ07988.1 amidohydrolase family protein [Sphingomonas panacisoli]
MIIRSIAAILLAGAALSVSAPVASQTPKDQLLTPPANAEEFVIVSSAGQHGTAWIWTMPDGTIASRQSFLLRGMVTEVDETIKLGPNGQPEKIVGRGITPNGDAAESFDVVGGKASWKTPIDAGSAAYDGKSQYATVGGTWADLKYWAESLYKAPNKTLTLLPSGTERMEKLVDIQVGSGPTAKTVTSWMIKGLSLEPGLVLMNQDGSFFGQAGGMALLPKAYADDRLKLQKAQIDAMAALNPAIRERFGKVSPVPVAFTHVKMFDAIAAKFLDDQTVIADKGKIVAVGPAAKVKVPAGTKVIDGTGKTLSPGIWDAHMHTQSDLQGIMLLSMGETSARNPGADVEPTIERNKRIAAGQLLYPTVYSSVLIDGKGPLAAQGGVAVSSAQEAIDAVRMAKEKGFTGVKFYTSMKPEWLWPAIKEAKKLGLHVHGHIPATLRPTDVIAGGYDEITHINFVMMQAMPDSVVNIDNGIERFNGPGKYAKDVDLTKEPMASLIKEMAAKKITVDPTLSAFENLYVPENGELQPAYTAFVGTMPSVTERYFRFGGFQPPAPVTRADWRASFAKMMELAKRLHDAGVPIVAGTDGGGLEIIRELELYVQIGLTTAEALQSATIVPARLVGADKATGSITVGKEADLVLVDGDASKDIGAMRRTLWVMSDGALMNADDLREVAGFSGRPK